jgi:hypothetical protein
MRPQGMLAMAWSAHPGDSSGRTAAFPVAGFTMRLHDRNGSFIHPRAVGRPATRHSYESVTSIMSQRRHPSPGKTCLPYHLAVLAISLDSGHRELTGASDHFGLRIAKTGPYFLRAPAPGADITATLHPAHENVRIRTKSSASPGSPVRTMKPSGACCLDEAGTAPMTRGNGCGQSPTDATARRPVGLESAGTIGHVCRMVQRDWPWSGFGAVPVRKRARRNVDECPRTTTS